MVNKSCIMVTVIFLCFLGSVEAQENLRAWHTQGQTFLIWEHSVVIPSATFDVYSALQPITSIDNATWIGRVFAGNGFNMRLSSYVPNSRWKLPDTAGGTVDVDEDEAYFVVTPHTPNSVYYAVVVTGEALVSPSNTVGPIEETVDPVGVVLQHEDDSLRVYGHWIDGRSDPEAGRPGYPVMGNQYCNGLGFNFAVWEPSGGRPQGQLPLVVYLHPLITSLFFLPHFPFLGGVYTENSEGFVVTFDDYLLFKDDFGLGVVNTYWVGYNTEYNRFAPTFPSDSARVVDYTWRRVRWELDRILEQFPIDTMRVSIMGMSMGGLGTLVYTQFQPDFYSAGLSFVPPSDFSFMSNRLIGTSDQNLSTTLDGQPGIYDVFSWRWRHQNLPEKYGDFPFTTIVSGKRDIFVGWRDKPDLFRLIDSTRAGCALYWDEREHFIWGGTHFRLSEHLHASYMTRFRKDRSYPAFSNTDVDLFTPGRQPDPGTGDPTNGDPWGTWGGYFEWDPESIVDTVDTWAVTMWVVSESQYPGDIPDADTILTDVTPRRLQMFQPQADLSYYWAMAEVRSGEILQEGTVRALPDDDIILPQLMLIKQAARLTLFGPDKKGDIIRDGDINIQDVVRCIHILLQVNDVPSEYERWAADMNGDGNIDVLDIVRLVRVIMDAGIY